MESKIHQLHIYFFPVMASGHMIPLVDMAKQFASHGVKATIVLTPRNAALFTETIERYIEFGLPICIRQVQFPSDASGLPIGCEDLASVTSPEMRLNFIKALDMFQEPLQQLLEEDQPDCIVADFFFSWTTEIASKLEIPRLVFHGTGVFPLCVNHSLMQHQPYKNIESETETFVIPGLPDTIKLSIQQIPEEWRETSVSHVINMFEKSMKSELTSYGVIVNSFHELESAYVQLYKEVMGRKKTWLVGPVSLCNRNNKDKAQRGQKASIDEYECLNWLNSKKPNSVLYICFGSMSNFSAAQLYEIAAGLEAAEQEFMWVVRKEKVDNKEQETWLPEGYEQRMEGKGLIIRGWAPQVLILDHEAVGAFVTHCGWNSLQEGVSAGVPMVTWPLYAEQFYNEKLITNVLRTGVAVGAQQWSKRTIEYKVSVKSNDIARAVRQVMVGEEAKKMRRRARALGDAAKRAVEEGGSSYTDLNSLLAELRIKRS